MIVVPVLSASPPPMLPLLQAQSSHGSDRARRQSHKQLSACHRGLLASSKTSSPKVLATTTRRARRAATCTHHTGRTCLIPGLNDLAANSVRPLTQELYLRAIRQLLQWAGQKTMHAQEAQWLDHLLEEYLLWIYDTDATLRGRAC